MNNLITLLILSCITGCLASCQKNDDTTSCITTQSQTIPINKPVSLTRDSIYQNTSMPSLMDSIEQLSVSDSILFLSRFDDFNKLLDYQQRKEHLRDSIFNEATLNNWPKEMADSVYDELYRNFYNNFENDIHINFHRLLEEPDNVDNLAFLCSFCLMQVSFESEILNIGLGLYERNLHNSKSHFLLTSLVRLLPSESQLKFARRYTQMIEIGWEEKNFEKLMEKGINADCYWEEKYKEIWSEFAKDCPYVVEYYESYGLDAKDLY